MALVDSVITCAVAGRTRESVDVGQTSRTPRIPPSSGPCAASSFTRWIVGKTSWLPSSPGSFISSYYNRVATGSQLRKEGRPRKTGIQPATACLTDRQV